MPKAKEKSYTRKKASLQTKAIFRDIGFQAGSQPSTSEGIGNFEQCSSACGTLRACSNTCCASECASICVPGADENTAATSAATQADCCSSAPPEGSSPCVTESDSTDTSPTKCSPWSSTGASHTEPEGSPMQLSDVPSPVSGVPEVPVCSSSTDALSKHKDFVVSLRSWVIKENVTHTALSALLKILKVSTFDSSSLPSDAHTLLAMPRDTQRAPVVSSMVPGHYCHFGLQKSLENALSKARYEGSHVSLAFNIDGLPISKRSTMQLWPIQCMIREDRRIPPFVVGIFTGPGKPASANEFLNKLVSDLQQLLSQGMIFHGHLIDVSLKCFVLDAPARSFVFQIKGHTGYSGCPKCTAEGTYRNSRLSFPTTSSTLRTNDSFRCQIDSDHHRGASVLTSLPIYCVTSAPLDYMHLLCLGIAKKLHNAWLSRPLDITPWACKAQTILSP
ncbi:uncharacterized protein LOC142790722 [Rhipicephalus microplus]|uniref:uncharacterized protein LOC142790722 n=1 Tax=Rhipicephalus microplus TaxID=6941 RepID=UPI003F6B3607